MEKVDLLVVLNLFGLMAIVYFLSWIFITLDKSTQLLLADSVVKTKRTWFDDIGFGIPMRYHSYTFELFGKTFNRESESFAENLYQVGDPISVKYTVGRFTGHVYILGTMPAEVD